jgi:hypothetical protein
MVPVAIAVAESDLVDDVRDRVLQIGLASVLVESVVAQSLDDGNEGDDEATREILRRPGHQSRLVNTK